MCPFFPVSQPAFVHGQMVWMANGNLRRTVQERPHVQKDRRLKMNNIQEPNTNITSVLVQSDLQLLIKHYFHQNSVKKIYSFSSPSNIKTSKMLQPFTPNPQTLIDFRDLFRSALGPKVSYLPQAPPISQDRDFLLSQSFVIAYKKFTATILKPFRNTN